MGDSLKLSKDKRHRSSSSIAEAVLEGTRSERKLDIKASIPESEDQFVVAEARCVQLKDKIDLVRELKKKKKFKKRSLTHMSDQTGSDDVQMIRVKAVPKKSLMVTEVSQQASRVRRVEEPPEAPRRERRAYPLPARRDRNRMAEVNAALRRVRADGGDDVCTRANQITAEPLDEVDSDRDLDLGFSDEYHDRDHTDNVKKDSYKSPPTRRRHTPRDSINREMNTTNKERAEGAAAVSKIKTGSRKKPATPVNRPNWIGPQDEGRQEERPVLELFNKKRGSPSPSPPPPLSPRRKASNNFDDQTTGPLDNFIAELKIKESKTGERRRIRRGHRYELPTVASQMKQAGVRYCYQRANHTDLPFVVSKSTTPSHNIGVNLQQVLNGLKIQQPLSGIPMTIAHHMGLRHLPFQAKSSTVRDPQNNQEMNVIKVGRKFVRLPSCRCSYNRLLSLYREGDGVVPRYLRAASRPHYFYTSMYNLTSTTRDDFDGSTSKGRGGGGGLAARQSLAEYAALYREYEQLDQRLQRGDGAEGDGGGGQRRRDELARQLAAREEHIRRIVQEYDQTSSYERLRASASHAEDASRRRSSAKLNLGVA